MTDKTICAATGQPCIYCTAGACDHRRTMREYKPARQVIAEKDAEIERLTRENKWLKHDLEGAELRLKAMPQLEEANQALLLAVLYAAGADKDNPLVLDRESLSKSREHYMVSGGIDQNTGNPVIYYLVK